MEKQEIINELRKIGELRWSILLPGNHRASVSEMLVVKNEVYKNYDMKRPTLPRIFNEYSLFESIQPQKESNPKVKVPVGKESIILGVAIIILCSFGPPFLGYLSVLLGLVAGGGLHYYRYKKANPKPVVVKTEPVVRRVTWRNKYENYDFTTEMETFLKECKAFDERFLVIADPWIQFLNAEDAKEEENQQKLAAAKEELSKCTVIDEEYYEYADRIASILEDDRAETLGEAITLALREAAESKRLSALEEQNKRLAEQNNRLQKIQTHFDIK